MSDDPGYRELLGRIADSLERQEEQNNRFLLVLEYIEQNLRALARRSR